MAPTKEDATYYRIGWIAFALFLLTTGVVAASSPGTAAWQRGQVDRVVARIAGSLGLHDVRVDAPSTRQLLPGRLDSLPPSLVTSYEVVASYPHDRRAFLQGLVWYQDGFYESTGLFGESTVRRVAFPSGDVLQMTSLSEQFFGEGLTLVGDRLVQLTWRSKRGFIYDRETFSLLGEFAYQTEGWGLTYDGTSLIMSDGSSTLTFLDPSSYQPQRTVRVTLEGRPVRDLNELEWIGGEVWANVWQTDYVVRIDPTTGQVTGVLDMTSLLPAEQHPDPDDVLNGIAYDPDSGRIFVSGKRWPLVFEIRLQ